MQFLEYENEVLKKLNIDPEMFKPKDTQKKPHLHKDKFFDFINRIYREFCKQFKSNLSEDKMVDIIRDINDRIKTDVRKIEYKDSERNKELEKNLDLVTYRVIISKCCKFNCFLGLVIKNTELMDKYITDSLNKFNEKIKANKRKLPKVTGNVPSCVNINGPINNNGTLIINNY